MEQYLMNTDQMWSNIEIAESNVMDCNASNGGAPNDIHNMQSLTEIYYSSHSINYIPSRIIHSLISIYPLILKKLSSIPVLLYVGCGAGYAKSPGNSRQLTS